MGVTRIRTDLKIWREETAWEMQELMLILVDLMEIRYEVVNWIHLAEIKVQCGLTGTNFQVPSKARNFLTN
jgi:hypothetical protein